MFERTYTTFGGATFSIDVNGPIPANLGECADLLHDTRELRLAIERDAEDVKKREAALRDHIIDNLSKRNEGGAAGKRYLAKITQKKKPIIGEGKWPDFFKFVQKTGRFDLLQKRLADKAVMDMVDAKETPPGVEIFNSTDVSITKL